METVNVEKNIQIWKKQQNIAKVVKFIWDRTWFV